MLKVVWAHRPFLLSLSVVIGLLGAAACGGAEEPTPTPTATLAPVVTSTIATPTPTATATPTPMPAVKPKRGGVINYWSSDDPVSFDIPNAASSRHSIHNAKLYNNLLWNPDGKSIAPDVAESYTISTDGKVWTFKLRNDVRFQSYSDNPGPRDGTLLTAKDAAYSLKRMMGLVDGTTSERCGWIKEFIDIDRPDRGLAAVDDSTLQVYMSVPFAEFPNVLVLSHCGLSPDGTTKDMLKKRPYGSGPFKLKSSQRGALWVFERNPDYFEEGVPYLNEIQNIIFKGGSAIIQAAFLTGRLDIDNTAPDPDNKASYDKMVAEGKVVLDRMPGTCTVQGLYMNSTKPPFNNPKLRKAVHLALDRKGYINAVFDGEGVPVTFVPTGDVPWFRTEEDVWKLPGYRQPKDQDLAEAKRIMAEEYPSGLEVKLLARDSSNYPAMAEFNAGELKKIGINATIEIQTSAVLFPNLSNWKYDLASYCMTMITMTAAEQFGSYYITGGSRNWIGYSKPKIDELFPRMVAASGAEKVALIREMERMMWEDIAYAPMAVEIGAESRYAYVQNYPTADPRKGFSNYSTQRWSLIWRSDV
ncbi:MAG: ABC transporter substrate-binding protein [Chloroflexi bacterium]|nr:ABC transporter substrate-binding protein [Chloroflexota bacterium]